MVKIRVGTWRDGSTGPMEVVFRAGWQGARPFPGGRRQRGLDGEMRTFLDWFKREWRHGSGLESRAGSSLVRDHPTLSTMATAEFGRARIADMVLARSEKQCPALLQHVGHKFGRSVPPITTFLSGRRRTRWTSTRWMEWFLGCLGRAIDGATDHSECCPHQGALPGSHRPAFRFNHRQRGRAQTVFWMVFEGKLTTSKYAKLAKCFPGHSPCATFWHSSNAAFLVRKPRRRAQHKLFQTRKPVTNRYSPAPTDEMMLGRAEWWREV